MARPTKSSAKNAGATAKRGRAPKASVQSLAMAGPKTPSVGTPKTIAPKAAPKAPSVPEPTPVAVAPVIESAPVEPVVDAAPVAEVAPVTPLVTPVAAAELAPPPSPELTETPPVAAEPLMAELPKAKSKEGLKMVDVVETTKKYAEQAKEKLGAVIADLGEKAKEAKEKTAAAATELTAITKGNVEAIVESGKVATKGAETFGQSAAEYSRTSFEKASAALKSFAAAKSPTEFLQLHSEFVTSSFDSLAKETAKNSEAMLKLAGDIVQPISNRVSIVTDKFKSLAS